VAPSARPSSVAVRSEPPRPSVATARSPVGAPLSSSMLALPMKPGTTGTLPAATSASSCLRAAASVAARLGDAPPNGPSVKTISVASTYADGVPAAARAAAKMCADRRSPRLTTKSRVRGVSSFSAARLVSTLASSSIDRSISAPTAFVSLFPDLPVLPDLSASAALTMAWYRLRSASTSPERPLSPPTARVASPRSTSVMPAGAETTTTAAALRPRTMETACR
jgi:hypothetical protein